MTLAELLESKFRGDIRFRGAAYLKAERVAITHVTPEAVYGLVRDGVEYETQLRRDADELRMHCSCSGDPQKEVFCKHLWGTILAVDEGDLLSGSAKPGYFPPFAVETEPFSAIDEDWDDDWGGDVYRNQPAANGRRGTLKLQPRLRPWEARLHEMRQEMQVHEAAPGKAARDREIFYEIDVAGSRTAGQLVVETSQRQQRTSGQWGKLKPLKLRVGQLDEVEREDDRKILAYLMGGLPERAGWYAQQAEAQGAIHRYRIPNELCELILPMMCATGRVRYLGANAVGSLREPNRSRSERTTVSSTERNPAVLEWDGGDPWEFSMRVFFDEAAGNWRMEGRFCRGDASLPLAAAELAVPGGLLLTKKSIARLRDFDAFSWISALSREPLVVPPGEEHELVDQLLDMPTLPRLDLPEELRLEEVHGDPKPHLVIRPPRSHRWHQERLQGEVKFEYLGTLIEGSSSRWALVQREAGRCVLRNRAREDQAWSQLAEHGFRRLLDRRRGGHDVEINAQDLGRAVRALIAEGWQIRAEGKKIHQPGELNFRVQSGIDWFELHGNADFEGHSVPFPELLSALARGDSTVRLDDGSLGILPEEWLQQYRLLANLGVVEGDHLRFAPTQASLLDALLATQPSVDFDDRFSELRERFRSFDGIAASDEPVGFHGTLRGYQRDGLGWLKFLEQFNFGGCLADDMGLGKTVQLLAMLQERRRTASEHHPSLIVVPKSLMFNWHQECTRFTPRLKVMEYTGVERAGLRKEFKKKDVVLTTYGTLRRDILHLKDVQFDYVVLDEAQTIKNSGSQVAKASRLLKANHRIALSGTPIENHLGDLWSIFEFLNPGMLGRSSIFKLYADDAKDEDSRKLLAQGLRPFILRRTKRQVAGDLPEKVEQTIHCDMGKEQRRLYNDMRDHYRDSLLGLVRQQGLAKSKIHVLEALLRLRQAACHPGLLDKSLVEHSSAKLDVLGPHLEELLEEGHKALVFSQFTSMLAIVKQHLDQRNIVYEYLDGQTRDRKGCVERFQNDKDCGVFLISLKAGGLGLNLTAADYVFLLDPWWNPAVESQAIDRAHRVGQTRQVFAYRLICRNTVEEKIAELQSKKRTLAEAILEADSNLLQELSTDDLEMLLS